MKDLNVSGLSLGSLTLLYLTLPLPIFFFGWLQPVYAIISVVPVLLCGRHLLRAWPMEPSTFRRGEIVLVAVFSFAITAFAGIGGFAPQTFDWAYHNAVLMDCINRPWPVVIVDGSARWALDYYVGYYLPAAVVGKIGGYAAAQVAWWVWSSLGVMLSSLWFARLTRLPAGVACVAFFAFAGLDFAANILAQVLGLNHHPGHLEFYPNQSWAQMWQFPAHFWALEWAPGQALPAWISAGMFLASPKALRPACFVFLFTCVLLWSPFAAVGLGLLALFLIWREGLELSFKPLVPMLALVLPFGVLVAFYAAKISPDVAARFPKIEATFFTQFHDSPGPFKSVVLMLLFAVSQFGIFLWFIRARFPKGSSERNLADACGLALICLLPVTVGYYSDLSMRASAVPLFGLALLTVRTVGPGGLEPKMRRWFALVILIGFLTPLIEVAHQAYHIALRSYDPRVVPREVSAVVHMADGGFELYGAPYVGSTNSFFWRNLVR